MIRVSCAIIIKERKILICRRGSNQSNPGKWEFPGGKVKKDEGDAACIIREIKEELAITIQPTRRLNPVIYGNHIELIPFICFGYSGNIVRKEHSQHRFITSEEFSSFDFTLPDVELCKYLAQNLYLLTK